MEVKFDAKLSNLPSQKKPNSGTSKAVGASFAENLKSAAGKEAQTAEKVFERVLSDRENPDLQQLDDYLEKLIQEEMKGRGT